MWLGMIFVDFLECKFWDYMYIFLWMWIIILGLLIDCVGSMLIEGGRLVNLNFNCFVVVGESNDVIFILVKFI